MKVGELDIIPVRDGSLTMSAPRHLFADGPPRWAPPDTVTVHDGQWMMDIGAFVVRVGERVLLLEAGAGAGDETPIVPPFSTIEDAPDGVIDYFRPRLGSRPDALAGAVETLCRSETTRGGLPASLEAAGVAPAEVTDVILSHLHWDHVGWVSSGGQPYFENATIHAERRDLDAFLGEDPVDESVFAALWDTISATERFAPVIDRVQPWDGDTSIAPGVDVRFAPGHTPGSSLVVLSSGSARAMILGDAVHCPLELMDSEFSLIGDMDQDLADRTREMISREIEDSATVVSAPHFDGLRFGRLLSGEGRRGWVFEQQS